MDFEIRSPEKSTYKFNEVTSITGVKPYVLRFWESEFGQIQPAYSEDGQKFYHNNDVELIGQIKKLLFEEKMSIPEAKKFLEEELKKAQFASETSESVELEEVFSATVEGNEETEETEKIEVFEAVPLSARSEELNTNLKDALEEIILKNSSSHTEEKIEDKQSFADVQIKAEQVVQKVTDNFKAENRHFSDQDVVSLVTAKKKLSNLLGKIDDICNQHHW